MLFGRPFMLFGRPFVLFGRPFMLFGADHPTRLRDTEKAVWETLEDDWDDPLSEVWETYLC